MTGANTGHPCLSRNRRSTRGTLYLDQEEEICDLISPNMSDEERLGTLLNMSIKHSLESTLSDSTVYDKLSITSSMLTAVEELQTNGLLTRTVEPSEKKACSEPVIDEMVEGNIKHAESYISKLKDENSDWDLQLLRYEKEANCLKREYESLKNETYKPCLNPGKQSDKIINYEEKLQNLRSFYDTFNNQLQVVNQTAATLDKFHRRADEKLLDEIKILNSSFELKVTSTSLTEQLEKFVKPT